ncbi:MAG TPA: elongation factor P maturation arginine rhamnosyltransferase EarP [Castellaniella sp.]|nr:elongation factor P maturation arginine rhamnosyltransferase EarP [Castellaniella sp.]
MNALRFDLFCRVVDNYGDAGVCWRLARQLASMGHAVRLWIDDLGTLARLVPEIDPSLDRQTRHGVEVGAWALADQAGAPERGVVIEAFACTPPQRYQDTLAARHCLWINLEYLSAEPWVEGCHGLPSPQANGVPKHFYFPGFTPATGGLPREAGLLAQRDGTARRDRRERLRELTGLPADDLIAGCRYALLFCYPDAPWAGLRAALAQLDTPTCLLVPGPRPPGLSDLGALRVLDIPFVPQSRFDELLWCCDLNFVRGEDSLVRAIWAGRPLVWQAYRQEDEAHLDKLEAWLDRARWPQPAQDLTRAWNRGDDEAVRQAALLALADGTWQTWQARSRAWADELAGLVDLATGLVNFCQKRLQKS